MSAVDLQLAALESRFAALEAKYNDLLEQNAQPKIDTEAISNGAITSTTEVKVGPPSLISYWNQRVAELL